MKSKRRLRENAKFENISLRFRKLSTSVNDANKTLETKEMVLIAAGFCFSVII